MKKDSIAIIPIRSGSKSIKNKNIKDFNGKPLAYHNIFTALNSRLFSQVIVASDSSDYKNTLNKYKELQGMIFIKRPKSISTDKSSTEDTVNFVLNKINFKGNVFLIQATSPLLIPNDLKEALKLFYINKYDSLFSCYESKSFIWELNRAKIKAKNYNFRKRPMRQDINPYYIENGAFYIFNSDKFKKFQNRLFDKIGLFVMNKYRSIDIDELIDFKIAKKIHKEINFLN